MVDMTMKTPLPQVLMENVLTEFSVWRPGDRPQGLPLVDGTSTDPKTTGNLLKYAAKDQKTSLISIEGKKCAELWYGCGNSTYYYKLVGESRFTQANVMTNSFLLGDNAVVASMGSGYPVFNVGHDMAGVSCNEPNFMVDNVWTKAIIIATKDEPELGNKVGDVWYQTGPATYFKAKDRTITYSDNPTTGAIDLSQTIQKPGFRLSIFPNPVLDSATISFVLPRDDAVSVLVYNALGQRVSSPLLQQNLPAGKQQVALDTNEFPAGTYIARIEGQSGEPQVVTFVVAR